MIQAMELIHILDIEASTESWNENAKMKYFCKLAAGYMNRIIFVVNTVEIIICNGL